MRKTNLLCVAAMALMQAVNAGAVVNVTGRVTCDGVGVSGVQVSDGYRWATTDAGGCYAMESGKENGYVFYVLPSGYEATATGFQPRFWAPLNGNVNQCETHDFVLNKMAGEEYKLIVATDLHLAATNNDVSQMEKYFVPSARRVVAGSTVPVYSLFLGDVVWDYYWYSNNFGFGEYVDLLQRNNYPTMIYHSMGNHDHDGGVEAGDECDFKASQAFSKHMGPRYYSLNLGKVHIIVLDDVFYRNETEKGKLNKGIVGSRNYDDKVTQEQLNWLRQDLSHIKDKSTPIIVAVHSQTWRVPTDGRFQATPYLDDDNVYLLDNMFHEFKDVQFVSGHSHYNFHAHPRMFPNIHENNNAAVCGTWWHTANYSPRHLCRDGSPAGYELYAINGTDIKWQYTPIDPVDSVGEKVMRVYDMNTVSEFYRTSPHIKQLAKYYPQQKMYNDVPANQVMINVWDYDPSWKVEVIENGVSLDVERIVANDPLHVLCTSVEIIKVKNSKPGIARAIDTNHMFVAQASTATAPIEVRVTDTWGRVFTQTLVRPKPFTTLMQ